tara:strand:+ start:612 stop:965 length:354 start_codon:yes stop_codon:yes gene_type:complete
MSIYKGNIGIFKGTYKGTEVVKLIKSVDGAYNSENAYEILVKALELSKARKLPLFTWSFYVPSKDRIIQQSDLKLVDDGILNPVLQADFFGKPALRLMKPDEKYSPSRKKNALEQLA